jgi:hypothetical protein
VASRVITSKELSATLGINEAELHNLAHSAKLPLMFSASGGWFSQRDQLPAFKAAAAAQFCATCGD